MELKFDPYTTVLIRVVRTWGRAYPPSHRGNGQPRLYIMALVSADPVHTEFVTRFYGKMLNVSLFLDCLTGTSSIINRLMI